MKSSELPEKPPPVHEKRRIIGLQFIGEKTRILSAGAGRTAFGEDLARPVGDVLPGHLDEAERRDLDDIRLRTVALELADAAGNATTVGGFSFTFHVVGPPVAVVEDVAFASYGDPRSTYPYRLSGQTAGVNTYSTLFDPGSRNFFGGQVRLLRYVISNPAPTPVGSA